MNGRPSHGRQRLVRTIMLGIGVLGLAGGLLLAGGGLLAVITSLGSMQAPEGAWALLLGLALTALGAIFVRSASLRATGRLLARGAAPTVRATLDYLGTGSGDCAECGGANAADAVFCQQCGTRLSAECRSCGQPNGLSALFCERCRAPMAHHPVPR